MPYIITTRTPRPTPDDWIGGRVPGIATRTAVATLDEAREAASDAILAHDRSIGYIGAEAQADGALSESGGTVGPLLDGTVIEVRRVTWERITHDTPGIETWYLVTPPAPFVAEQIVAAFNAA